MKQNITVVSLGPGDPELLTAQSLNTMKKAKRLISARRSTRSVRR